VLTSIATVSISGSLDAKLRAIADARFDGVEIFENDLLTYDGGTPRDVRELMRDLGLTCTLYQPFRDFEGMPDSLRARVFDRAERKFDVMQALGADLVLVCSNVSPMALGDRSRIVADLRELGERAHARELRVGFEALAWGRHVFDHRDAWSIVKEVDHPAVGLILDSFHSLARNIPVESLREIDPAKIFIVQLADAPRLQMDYLSWSRHFRNLPGQGDFPLVDYVATLIERGYRGALSLEIFNDRFRASSASTVALDGKRSLNVLLDQIARNDSPAIAATMPARARVSGVEFIEFAANEEETPALAGLFTALGFERAGQHRSKDVTRWRQNGINFVINSEPESFARSYDHMHGASVCAIGLQVEDVEGTMRRAQELQIPSFTQPLRAGEMRIPSLRGVGGSLIYLVEAGQQDAVWETDFLSVQGVEATRSAGLVGVDHIAQTMQYEEMLSWLLYYVSLFDVAKTSQVPIADPLGLVYSQAIESADGGFRVTLNGSASGQTLSSRFLQGFHGAGVQHIALRTQDILASARSLRDKGLETLPIPRNYYEDLPARFGLDEALVEELASLNILYDRDGKGEYFQLYSRAFAKRFFFELVERRQYNGYGIANAVIRIAAQSRYRSLPPT
jgi:4-hydroxyphenylpyruvate dioxygenase